jgi:hypothetical protein
MIRPIRIGLIAEGETELGEGIPYIKPEEGGKVIDRAKEGELHTLIRRELENSGFSSCDFVQRHPLFTERQKFTLRTGHSIIDPKYLSQIIILWKPVEVDLILLVVDADNVLEERQRDLAKALKVIREFHLDANDQLIGDRSAVGLAVINFDTWLLADRRTISTILEWEIENIEDLESSSCAKEILEDAIAKSNYMPEETSNQRLLIVKWKLASKVNLDEIKVRCQGYGAFVKDLLLAAQACKHLLSFDPAT